MPQIMALQFKITKYFSNRCLHLAPGTVVQILTVDDNLPLRA